MTDPIQNLTDLNLQIFSMIELDLGLRVPLHHLSERVRHREPALGHTAEVDGDVSPCLAMLLYRDHKMVVLL